MEKGLISVVTPNFNGIRAHYLQPFFKSIYAQTNQNFEVAIVDNASTDNSVEWIRKNYPATIIIQNQKNLFYARPCNQGVARARGEFLAILNNDMVLNPRALANAVAAFSRDPKIAALNPKTLFYTPFLAFKLSVAGRSQIKLEDFSIDNTFYKKTLLPQQGICDGAVIKTAVDLTQKEFVLRFKAGLSGENLLAGRLSLAGAIVWEGKIGREMREYRVALDPRAVQKNAREVINNASSWYDPQSGAGNDVGIGEDDREQYDRPKEAQALMGGALFVRKNIIEKYGLFDEWYRGYYEDTDFSWRLKNAGEKLWYEPSIVVRHIHTGTSGEGSPLFQYLVGRNRLATLIKNGRGRDIGPHFFGFAMKAVGNFGRFLIGRCPWTTVAANLKALFSLKIHFIPLLIKRYENRHF